MEIYAEVLCKAVNDYNYPTVTYDFERGVHTCTDVERKMYHPNMCEVEGIMKSQLLSKDIEKVKDGLSNVVYWGNAKDNRQNYRVSEFRKKVADNDSKLSVFRETVRNPRTTNLYDIKRIGLPQFSNMSFVSKVRMFLDPADFPVLDREISKLACVEHSPIRCLKINPTHIPIHKPDLTKRNNHQIYEDWAAWCRGIACLVSSESSPTHQDIRAVDVERGIYHLIDPKSPPIAQGQKNSDIVQQLLKCPEGWTLQMVIDFARRTDN